MKKILIISDSYLFPPRNGMELPIYKAVENLHNHIDFDLTIINSNSNICLEKKRSINDNFFSKIDFIETEKVSFFTKLRDELFLKKPFYSNMKIINNDFQYDQYDFIWISNTRNVGFIFFIKKYLYKTVLTINDSNYYTYYERIKTVFNGKVKASFNKFLYIFRLPFLVLNEKKYLKKVSKIHVQTSLEKARTVKLFIDPKKIHVIQNGIDIKLMNIKYKYNSNKILLMSHMTEGREYQTYWFLEKIWPKVLNFNNSVELLIVGSMPKNIDTISKKYKNVIFKNYVNELSDAYSDVALSVIPHYQSSGFINRLSYSISAGVPSVISRKISLTYPQFLHEKHGFIFDNNHELINFIIKTLDNKKLRLQFSKNLNNLAIQQPDWNSFARGINELLLN